MRELIEEFVADRDCLRRLHPISFAPDGIRRLVTLHEDWLARIAGLDFDGLDSAAQTDYVLFDRHLRSEISQLDRVREKSMDWAEWAPFADVILDLEARRVRHEPVDAPWSAAVIEGVSESVDELVKRLADEDSIAPPIAFRAHAVVKELSEAVDRWFTFFGLYDPLVRWWTETPVAHLKESMSAYLELLKKRSDDKPGQVSVAPPVGRAPLEADLAADLIPYSPEELIAIADREFAWCRQEMMRAAEELGFGDDWRAAQEHVKTMHVAPGGQPAVVRDLALEAIEFLEEHDLLTIPDLAKETWRMRMMTPAEQKINPFFLGGETIYVSYPTADMTHAEKLMSMRGNNRFFSRATVQHELIPGHHMQFFMLARHRPYRELFGTPFWIEGWALYWEMLLWDLGFPSSPEERIGMLFWRTHRCVRIVFSLKFHLGEMSADECVDMLVNEVGHERATAEGEIRRSFQGSYPPLYQLAYMIGGLQFRAMAAEIVPAMGLKPFHDAILRENEMPVTVLRSVLKKERFAKEGPAAWRFDG